VPLRGRKSVDHGQEIDANPVLPELAMVTAPTPAPPCTMGNAETSPPDRKTGRLAVNRHLLFRLGQRFHARVCFPGALMVAPRLRSLRNRKNVQRIGEG